MAKNETRSRELLDLIDYAEQGFSYYRKDFIEIEQMYHCIMDKEIEKYLDETEKSKLYFNKSQAKSRRISDSLLKNYFSNDKFATILSTSENNESVKIATAVEKEVQEQLSNRRFFNAVARGLYKVPYAGTLITRTYWDNGIICEDVNLQDFFFDRDAISQEDVRYLVHNVYLAVEDVKRLQRSGVFDKSIDIDGLVYQNSAKSFSRLKIQEIYTKSGGEWKVSSVYDKSHFFRIESTLKDGQPFTWGGLLPQNQRIDELYFIVNYYEPVLSAVKNLQMEYNSRRNQIIDAVRQSLSPKLLVPKQSGINPLDLKKPVGYISCNNPQAIVVLPTADYRGGLQEMQILDQEMSETTGVNPLLNGVSFQQNKTATQSGMEHTEGSLKLEIYTRHLNETYFEPLIKRIAMLCWKYAPETNFIGIDRRKTPDLKVSFNTGLGVVNDVVKTELLDRNFMRMEKLLQYQMQVVPEKAKDTLKGLCKLTREGLQLSGIKNSDEYLGKEEDDELGETQEPPMIQPQAQMPQAPQMMQQQNFEQGE